MSTGNTNNAIRIAVARCEAAIERLIELGLSNEEAEARVKANFNRINSNANLLLTVEELCK